MKHRYPHPILSLLLTAAFFLSGCAQDLLPAAENDAEILSETTPPSVPPAASPSPAPPETEIRDFPDALPDGYQAASAVFFEESPAYSMPAEALDLMQSLEDASGHKMEKYIYVDMDHDGKKEMMGAYEENGVWSVWYANSDNDLCQPVTGLSRGYDTCTFEKLDLPDETHIVICDWNMLGTGKQYSIYRLEDQKLHPLVQNQYGYVYQNQDGNIILNVEAYDAQYDPDLGHMIGHTWTDTYLYYEDGRYKEYGALILSDTQFLQYDNAADLLADIRSENAEDEIQFTYFLRENGIVHIQCDRTTEYGSIYYYHYTLHAEGSHLVGGLESKNEGRMDTYFSTLEVTYPEAETFS